MTYDKGKRHAGGKGEAGDCASLGGAEAPRAQMPRCLYRKHTISEILNAIIGSGFCLKRFDEHPSWWDETVPGEFTAVAVK